MVGVERWDFESYYFLFWNMKVIRVMRALRINIPDIIPGINILIDGLDNL